MAFAATNEPEPRSPISSPDQNANATCERRFLFFNLSAAPSTAATPDQQLFGYLCDEVTGQFSDGQTCKRLR